MLGEMNVLTEKILEINPLVQAGLSFDYVSFQFGLIPYQHGSTHEGIHVSILRNTRSVTKSRIFPSKKI